MQFDPLESPGARNQDLVFHARIRGYQRAWCDAWLYGDAHERQLFEAYNKSLNILPLDDLPYHRVAWERARRRYEPGIFAERAASVRHVIERLRDEGPLSTADFKSLKGPIDWHWAPTAEGRAILEALFESGHVGLVRREGGRKTFDLIERVFPRDVLERRVDAGDAHRHRLLSRYRAIGLMGSRASPEIVHGTGNAAERARIVKDLVETGTLVEARVDGLVDPRFVLADELPLVEATRRPDPKTRRRGVAFLAPLDPLLWDRRLLRTLFEFDYLWEVYVPESKRRHGYYVLPILFGDRFVGRIEPRYSRETRALSIVGIAFEQGFSAADEEAFLPAFTEALRAFGRFVGAERIVFDRTRTSTPALRKTRAVRLLRDALGALVYR